jgi:hypothetical protein
MKLKSMFTHVFNNTLFSTLIGFIENSHWPFLSIRLNLKSSMVLLKPTTSWHLWFCRGPMTLTITDCLNLWQAATGFLKLAAFLDYFH